MKRLGGTEAGQFKRPNVKGEQTMCVHADRQRTSKGPHFSTGRKQKKMDL